MKQMITLLLAIAFCCSLVACGKQPNNDVAVNATVEMTAATEPENWIVKEMEVEGIRFTEYWTEDGILVWDEFIMPDGTYGEEHYHNAEKGLLSYMIIHQPDGSIMENHCYPDGTSQKEIFRSADGSCEEYHFANNGEMDAETMTFYPGTMVYAHVTDSEGTVTYQLELEEDFSGWEWQLYEDGTINETRYDAGQILAWSKQYHPEEGWWTEYEYYEDGTLRHSVGEDPNLGIRDEWEYFPNGNRMKITVTYLDSDAYSYTEYYQNGVTKHYINIEADGTKTETKYNEEGYYTYLYAKNLAGETEHFADETGKLIKYVENGTTYEGDAIPSWVVESFNEMQKYTQNQDN